MVSEAKEGDLIERGAYLQLCLKKGLNRGGLLERGLNRAFTVC